MKSHIRISFVALVAMFALIGAACGSNSDSSSGEKDGGATSDVNAQESGDSDVSEEEQTSDEGGDDSDTQYGELETVIVGHPGITSFQMWLVFAKSQGIMEKYGVNLETPGFQTVSQAIPALLAGSINIALTTPVSTWPAQDKDPDLVAVGEHTVGDPYDILVPEGVNSLRELKGKDVAVNTVGISSDNITWAYALAAEGMSISDVNLVAGGPITARLAAVIAGQLGATSNYSPGTQKGEQLGLKVITSGSDYSELSDTIGSWMVADRKWAAENRDLLVKYCMGYLATMEWVYDSENKDAAIADIAEAFDIGTSDASAVYNRFIVELQALKRDGVVDEEGFANLIHHAEFAGLPTVDPVSIPNRIDNSFMIEAAEKLAATN